MDNSFFDLPPEIVLKNTKTKIYPDGSTNTIYCNHYIFVDKDIKELYSDELNAIKEKLESERKEKDVNQKEKQKKDKISNKTDRERTDSIKRSRDKVFDIARMNKWKYFITITFDGSKYESQSPDFVMKKVNNWLRKKVQIQGLKYLLIPERHKKGGIHCHALVNDRINVVDSNTRLVYGYNRPVTLETINQRNLIERAVVYNIPSWKYGFSTAIEVDNSTAFAYYITKYITKGNKKIFGQYYWSSRNCQRNPEVAYTNTDFSSIKKTSISKINTSYQYKYQSNNLLISNFDELASKFDDIASFLDYIYSDEYKKLFEYYEEHKF